MASVYVCVGLVRTVVCYERKSLCVNGYKEN